MYGIQDKINQILRGAETIKKNQMNTTDAPRRPLRPEELFDEGLKLKERAEKAEAENKKLCEIIEDFYAWTRAEHPTEADVRNLMNRYYDLLNNIQTK